MISRKLWVSLLSTSLIAVPVHRAQANDAAALIGGAILGGIIVNEVNKNKQRQQTTRRYSSGSGISAAQREQNRQVQTALNYFGYNVGTVDGSLGRNSRAGISRYQADMGYTADGYLDDYERDFLLTSHQRALASSHVAPYNQVMAAQGPGGLLRTYRNEQLGIPTQQPQTPPVQQAAAVEPKTVPAKTENAALPNFTFGKVSKSPNEHCNETNVLTAANGGVTTAGRVTDPEFALSEQFCLARTHAMAETSQIEATIPNMTPAQIEQQCQGLTQAVRPHVSSITTAYPQQVTDNTLKVMKSSGQPMAQLISSGKVCLGVGYRIDDPEMALASAVLLTSAGMTGYGEAVSHHLREGFGVSAPSAERAGDWMGLALESLDSGGTQVMGQSPDRVAVLRDATYGGGSSNSASGGGGLLPVFPSSN